MPELIVIGLVLVIPLALAGGLVALVLWLVRRGDKPAGLPPALPPDLRPPGA